MEKKSTLLKSLSGKTSLVKSSVLVFLVSALFFAGCYEWRRIIQPEAAAINSYFDVFVSAQSDDDPDNDWTNPDLVDFGLFGVMIPDGWSVEDDIPFNIVCSDPSYSNSGTLSYSFLHSKTLEDSIGSPDGYHWWGAKTDVEASMVYFDSLYFEPRINTGSETGDFFLRYAIGDQDYWDRNPAEDISDPIPITIYDPVGVEELLSENVSLYPNPATDVLNIEFKNYKQELITVQISDISGRLLIDRQINDSRTSIGLENMLKGVYFVRLSNGNISETHKIFVN